MDAMEDMIVALYEKTGQLQMNEAFYSWSKTILVNRCKTLLRKNNRFVPLEDEQEPSLAALTALTDNNPFRDTESEMDMQVLLSHLNAQQREAIELRYVHDLPYQRPIPTRWEEAAIPAKTRASTWKPMILSRLVHFLTLTLTFSEWLDNGEKVSYPLSFEFEANKAMKSIIKENLSESIEVEQGTVHYDSITASPTSTTIKDELE